MYSKVSLISINTRTNLGEITERKINAIRQKLQPNFQTLIKTDLNEVVFVNEKPVFNISLMPQQISITAADENIGKKSLEAIRDYYNLLSEVFLFDDVFNNVLFRFLYTPKFEVNTMEHSIKIHNNLIYNGLSNVSGIGLRYFMKNEYDQLDEFKFEPMVSDPNRLYFEGIYQLQKIKWNEIVEISEEKLLDFTHRVDALPINL